MPPQTYMQHGYVPNFTQHQGHTNGYQYHDYRMPSISPVHPHHSSLAQHYQKGATYHHSPHTTPVPQTPVQGTDFETQDADPSASTEGKPPFTPSEQVH